MAPSGQVEAMAMAVIFHMLSASKCSHIKTDISSIVMGLSIRKHPAIGVPPFMEAPILFSILRSCYRDAVTRNGSEFVQRPKSLKSNLWL